VLPPVDEESLERNPVEMEPRLQPSLMSAKGSLADI